MKNILPVASFDWDGFLEETLKNLGSLVTLEQLVIKQVDKKVIYYSQGWKNLDLVNELHTTRTRLFVPFAIDNLDNAVVLADGTTKLYIDPAVVSTEDEDTYESAIDEARHHRFNSDLESVGFIFERHGDELVITAGWYIAASERAPASLDVLAENEELDFYGFAMERYIDQFILT